MVRGLAAIGDLCCEVKVDDGPCLRTVRDFP